MHVRAPASAGPSLHAAVDANSTSASTGIADADRRIDCPLRECTPCRLESADERLLEQDSVAAHPFKPTATPPRPDSRLWQILITALLEKGMINDANRLFKVSQSVAKRDGLAFWCGIGR